jgi:hypothetical protein
MIDSCVATFNPAEFLELLSKGGKPGVCFRIALGIVPKHANPPHSVALLRSRSERPRAKRRDERPPSHSITSSARASNVGGTSMPSALAVFILRTSSHLVGACTGKSLGFSRLRMRST